jgi:hypothetical protein
MSRACKTTRSAFIRVALEAEIQRQRVQFDVWNGEQDWGA